MSLKRRQSIKEWLTWLLVVPATLLSLVVGLRLLLKLWRNRLPWVPDILPPDLDELEGLTDEEAALRRVYDPDEENQKARRKINRAIFRRNTVSIFNISMLGLAIVTFLLDDLLGALATLGVLLANIVVNTVQQAFAVYNVDKIAAQSRPKVNSIRSGQGKAIRIDEIVVGDILVVGLGDQILADGKVLRAADNLRVNDKVLSEVDRGSKNVTGDTLKSGSYCVQGWAAYEVQELPAEELRTTQLNAVPETRADLTPLQKIIDQILKILLGLLVIFVFFLAHSVAQWDVVPAEVQELYTGMASIIFSIAPSGLFFMIIVSYNMGTFDLLKLGALVRDSRSVESLAQVTTLCFGKSGTLTGIDVQVEMLPQHDEVSSLSESRIRQILGDFAHNSASLSPFLTEMRKAFDGQPRTISREMRFLSTYGWSALNFSDIDLIGTYVLGRSELFQVEIPVDQDKTSDEGDDEQQGSVVKRTWGRVRGFFNRGGDESEMVDGTEISLQPGQETHAELRTQPEDEKEAPQDDVETPPDETKPGIFGRVRKRVVNIVRREGPPDESSTDDDDQIAESSQLVFGYSPEERPLFDETGQPILPENLTLLSILTFTEQLRPEAKEAIEIFTDAGVKVAIISQQDAKEVVAAARQLGLVDVQEGGLRTISGKEIEFLGEDQFIQAARQATIFAPVTPVQKGKITKSLNRGGEYVAMIGEGLEDIEAMQQANLSIAIHGGAQAAVGFADIVLLKDSLQALPQVLQQGRRIVNGLIDVLKLNLVQVSYISFLLVAMILTRNPGFYYDPAQGGLIVFFAVVIPSVGLTFWASSGAISEERILPQLLRFIIPVGLTITLASLGTYYGFMFLTNDTNYAQLGVTYTLSLTGILMILFVKPPSRFWVGNSPLSGDKRVIGMVLVMFVLFGIAMMIPLAQKFLKVALLQTYEHYVFIGVVVFIWVLVTKMILMLPGLRFYHD